MDRLVAISHKEYASLPAVFIPPKQEQAFNQGGTFLFDGADTVFAHYDASTGAHSSIEEVIGLAKERLRLRADAEVVVQG
jgi:hypothetical protein